MLLNTDRTKAERQWISKWRYKNKTYVVKQNEMDGAMGWHLWGKRPERKLVSCIFSLSKNQVWQWDWARQLQQPAFTWHSPFINCYLAALRSHGYKWNSQPPSPSTITLKKHTIDKNNVGQNFLVFIFNSSLWGCKIDGVFYGVKYNNFNCRQDGINARWICLLFYEKDYWIDYNGDSWPLCFL